MVYCCSACNRYKSDFWFQDPEQNLLHPLLDNLSLHYQPTADGLLAALTVRGKVHLQRLRLNRPQLLVARVARWQRLRDQQEKAELNAQIERIQQYRAELEDQLQKISEELSRNKR